MYKECEIVPIEDVYGTVGNIIFSEDRIEIKLNDDNLTGGSGTPCL